MNRTGATVVIVLIVVALIGGSFAFIFGSATDGTPEEAASAETSDRFADGTASRGANRQPELAALQLTEAASSSLTSPADEPNPTTTSTSTTSTTLAPVTPPVAPEPVTPAAETTTVAPPTTTAAPVAKAAPASRNTESGQASYYSHKAGGCAHKTIAKGTTVAVTNTSTGATATCVVNDRGPFVAGRVVDLDITVFRQIGSTSAGVVPVRISW